MRRRLARALRALAVDADLLRRRRELRLLIAGQATSLLGSMITFVAIPVQVYDLTGSTVAVGLLGGATGGGPRPPVSGLRCVPGG